MRILKVIVRTCVKSTLSPEEAYLYRNVLDVRFPILQSLANCTTLQNSANAAARNGWLVWIEILLRRMRHDVCWEHVIAHALEFRRKKVFNVIRRIIYDAELVGAWSARLGFVQSLRFVFKNFSVSVHNIFRVAAAFGRVDVFEAFPDAALEALQCSCKILGCNGCKDDPVFTVAAGFGHLDLVKFIVDTWGHILVDGSKILHISQAIDWAATYGHRDVVLYLLQFPHESDPNDSVIEYAFNAVVNSCDEAPHSGLPSSFLKHYGFAIDMRATNCNFQAFMSELKDLGASNFDEAFEIAETPETMTQLVQWGAGDFSAAFRNAAYEGDEKRMRFLVELERKVYFKKVTQRIDFDETKTAVRAVRQFNGDAEEIVMMIDKLNEEYGRL